MAKIVTQKKGQCFYGSNVASIRILPSGVKQYVSRGSSSQCRNQLASSPGGCLTGRVRGRVALRCSGGHAPAVPGTASLASTGLDTAGAERGHQIRKELRILAAAKD